MFSALFQALMLGFGIAIGTDLVFWKSVPASLTDVASCNPCGPSLGIAWQYVFFFPYSFVVNMFFQSSLKQWPIMTFVALIGYVIDKLHQAVGCIF